MLLVVVVLVAAAAMLVAVVDACPGVPSGYFSPNPRTPNAYVANYGPPEDNTKYKYVLEPDFLTCDDISKLNRYCVSQINRYRSGELKFTGDKPDAALGSPPALQEAKENANCQAALTLGDFALMGSGDCGAGAHKNAWACKAMSGTQGQNACCPRSVASTYEAVASALDQCLQQMWDEGLTPNGPVVGHWLNMKKPTFEYASCAVAFAKSASSSDRYVVNMQQNFASRYNASVARQSVFAVPSSGARPAAVGLVLLLLLVGVVVMGGVL